MQISFRALLKEPRPTGKILSEILPIIKQLGLPTFFVTLVQTYNGMS